MRDGLESGTIMLAMGNSDVPVGQYTQKIFDYYGLDEAALTESGCITYGTNVKEVATQVAEATVDCGVIYATDAFSENLTVVDTATAEMCGQVIYPAAVPEHQRAPGTGPGFPGFRRLRRRTGGAGVCGIHSSWIKWGLRPHTLGLIALCQRLAPMGLDSPVAGRVGEKHVSFRSFSGAPPPDPGLLFVRTKSNQKAA